MSASVDDFCVGKDQFNKTHVEKVVGHLVNEVGRGPPICAGVFNKLLSELLKSLSG